MNHQENNDQLPPDLYRFFWEYDQQNIDIHKHSDLIMTRIMARGNWQSMVWLREIYSVNKIRNFLFRKGWKLLSFRELNYWALVGGVSDQQRKELLWKARKKSQSGEIVLFVDVLSEKQKEILPKLVNALAGTDLYLAGGTALACNYSQPRHLCTIAPAHITDYSEQTRLRKYDAAVSSYRAEEMKTHSYLPCEELPWHCKSGIDLQ